MQVSASRHLTPEVDVEPVVAWRAWALTGRRDGSELLLRPVAGRSRPWKPLEPAQAACKHARMHAAPNIDCSCGLHAAREVELLRRTRTPAVLGRVALWGRVIEHDHGYRAQFAYPQRLGLICQFCMWLWGAGGSHPAVVGLFSRDDMIPLCHSHLDVAERYGMHPRRLLDSDEVERALLDRYAVDPLAW